MLVVSGGGRPCLDVCKNASHIANNQHLAMVTSLHLKHSVLLSIYSYEMLFIVIYEQRILIDFAF